MEGGNAQDEIRHGSADGNSDRQRPNVGPRNQFFSRGRGYRGGFPAGGPRPPLLNMFNYPDARSFQNGPGNNRGNMRHFPERHFDRNQGHGGMYNPNASYNFNNVGGNNFPMYNNNLQQQHQQQQQRFINQNYNYPQHRGGRNGNWREGREDPRDRDNNKEYDPEILKLLEEEGLYQLKKKSMKYPRANFFCRICQSPCDEPENCLVHIKSNRHQKLATVLEFDEYLRNLPLPTPAMLEAIEEVLETTAEQQGMSPEEKKEREQAVQDLVTRLQDRAPDAHLELIGSTYSGLALKTSDVNVALTVPDNVSPFHSIMELKQLIEECPHYIDVSNDLRSSFPSLSYTSSEHGGCRVVVGMGSPPMRAMTRLMAVYASTDERFVVLARALRHWAQLCHVSDQRSGNMPAIAYTVMVVHFLQQTSPPVLPILRHLVPSLKPEEFPLPRDVKSDFTSLNKQSVGELWHQMLHYYAHEFNFAAYNVNVVQITPSKKDKAYSKKVSIEDPFNPKRNLTRTVSNSAVFEFIIDRLFKVLCRYFSVPQLSYGQLFYTLTLGNTLMKEKRTNNCLLTKSSGKKESSESENENNQSSELDQALERLSVRESSVDSQDDDASKFVTSPDNLESTFDTITIKEANRIMNLLNKEHFKFEFKESKFTEGETVPIFCSSCQQEGHTREDCEDEKLPSLLPLGDINPSHIQLLSDILVKLRGEMEPSPEEMNLRDSVVNTLQYHIENEPKYGDALLQLFGSSANGFGFAYSDLDVCITFKNGNKEHFDQSFLIQDLARILRQSRAFTDVFTIPTAKVPIVKFRCLETQLEGDLSLYNTLGVHNTRLLWTYSVIDPRVKVLGHSLKYFAKRCDIGDASRGSLSSYAFTLLLIHFLQQCEPPVVPVLQKLYDPADPPKPVIVEGWNTWFYSDLKNLASVWPELGTNKSSVGDLWIQMFRYYTETFDFEENIVTIRQKEPLMRLEKLWNNHGIAIEDPFDLSHNLGGALSRKMNTFILKAFINGRHMYGGVMKMPFGLKDTVQFLFDPKQLTAGAPPNDRGCRKCRKIGHHVKNCPQRGNAAAGDENKRKKDQHRKGGNQAEDSSAPREVDTKRPNPMQERLAASGNAPTKKRDEKALLGEKGVDKIAEIVPEGDPVGDTRSRTAEGSQVVSSVSNNHRIPAARSSSRHHSNDDPVQTHSGFTSSESDSYLTADETRVGSPYLDLSSQSRLPTTRLVSPSCSSSGNSFDDEGCINKAAMSSSSAASSQRHSPLLKSPRLPDSVKTSVRSQITSDQLPFIFHKNVESCGDQFQGSLTNTLDLGGSVHQPPRETNCIQLSALFDMANECGGSVSVGAINNRLLAANLLLEQDSIHKNLEDSANGSSTQLDSDTKVAENIETNPIDLFVGLENQEPTALVPQSNQDFAAIMSRTAPALPVPPPPGFNSLLVQTPSTIRSASPEKPFLNISFVSNPIPHALPSPPTPVLNGEVSPEITTNIFSDNSCNIFHQTQAQTAADRFSPCTTNIDGDSSCFDAPIMPLGTLCSSIPYSQANISSVNLVSSSIGGLSIFTPASYASSILNNNTLISSSHNSNSAQQGNSMFSYSTPPPALPYPPGLAPLPCSTSSTLASLQNNPSFTYPPLPRLVTPVLGPPPGLVPPHLQQQQQIMPMAGLQSNYQGLSSSGASVMAANSGLYNSSASTGTTLYTSNSDALLHQQHYQQQQQQQQLMSSADPYVAIANASVGAPQLSRQDSYEGAATFQQQQQQQQQIAQLQQLPYLQQRMQIQQLRHLQLLPAITTLPLQQQMTLQQQQQAASSLRQQQHQFSLQNQQQSSQFAALQQQQINLRQQQQQSTALFVPQFHQIQQQQQQQQQLDVQQVLQQQSHQQPQQPLYYINRSDLDSNAFYGSHVSS